MGPNACAKTLRLGDQLFLCHGFQIFVQVITYLQWGQIEATNAWNDGRFEEIAPLKVKRAPVLATAHKSRPYDAKRPRRLSIHRH